MYQFVANFSKKRIDYYPFGLKHSGYNSDQLMYIKQGTTTKIVPVPPLFTTSYQYKYNGKELQEELGLNFYDYGARNYMADIGRWMNIDVLSEASRRFSPYTYAMDNPVFFIDVDGMFTDTLESQNIENCCPGFPFGRNSPKETSPLGKTMQNFTPSDKTMSLLSEGKELLTNVFGYEASATAGYGLGLEGRVGPIKAEGELTLAEAEVKTTDKNLIEAGIKAPGFKFNASLGEKKAELKGSLSTAKVEIDKNLNVKTSSEGATLKGTISKGDANLSLKNSGTLGLSIKLPSPDGISGKIGATINLYNAVIGVGKMIEGGASYLKDYVSNFFSGN